VRAVSDVGPLEAIGTLSRSQGGEPFHSLDADYQISPSQHIDDREVVALVGILGTEAGNATCVSLAVSRLPLLVGVQSIEDTELVGTSEKLEALQHERTLFYVHCLARDCSGLDPCLEIPRKLIPPGETIKIIQRN
jgi:hypothetical protein